MAIIGGGPAGMEAALLMKKRGFAPVIFEKSGKLGGSAILASALKEDSTVENLGEIAGETYGNLSYLSVADWMPADLLHK